MAKEKRRSPSFCKWWMDDWATSSLRKRLRTPSLRLAYREFWDLCMSSPDPGAAVDSAGEPYTDAEICEQIGIRRDVFRRMIQIAERLGRVTTDTRDRHETGAGETQDRRKTGARETRDRRRLDTRTVKKSLPDHWKYKRLRRKRSEYGQDNDAPRQKQRQKQRQKKKPPISPLPSAGVTDEYAEEGTPPVSATPPPGLGPGPNGRNLSPPARAAWTILEPLIEKAREAGTEIFLPTDAHLERLGREVPYGLIVGMTVDHVQRAWAAYMTRRKKEPKARWGIGYLTSVLNSDMLDRAERDKQEERDDAGRNELAKRIAAKKAIVDENEAMRAEWAKLPNKERRRLFDIERAEHGALGNEKTARAKWWKEKKSAQLGKEPT